MRIRFDDELENAPNRGPVVQVEDLKAAKSAVAFCRRELEEAVAETQALDGISGWVSWITGNHENDVQRALGVVKQKQMQLARAEAHVAALSGTLKAVHEEQRSTQELQVERAMYLELVADQLRSTGGQAAGKLRALEHELEQERAHAGDLDTVFATGTAVRGKLSRALVLLTNVKFGATMDVWGATSGGAFKMIELRKVRSEMEGMGEQLRRFTDACDLVGIDVTLGEGVQEVETAWRSSLVDGMFDGFLMNMLSGSKIRQAHSSLESLKFDVSAVVDPVVKQRKALSDKLKALEAQRDALLEEQA